MSGANIKSTTKSLLKANKLAFDSNWNTVIAAFAYDNTVDDDKDILAMYVDINNSSRLLTMYLLHATSSGSSAAYGRSYRCNIDFYDDSNNPYNDNNYVVQYYPSYKVQILYI